jgi:hypothetical protein
MPQPAKEVVKRLPFAENIGMLIPGAIVLLAIRSILREFPTLLSPRFVLLWTDTPGWLKLLLSLMLAWSVGFFLHLCSRSFNRLVYNNLYPVEADPLFQTAYNAVKIKRPDIKKSSVYFVCKRAIDSGDPALGKSIELYEGFEKFCRTLSLCLILVTLILLGAQIWLQTTEYRRETAGALILLVVLFPAYIHLRRRAGGLVYQSCPRHAGRI